MARTCRWVGITRGKDLYMTHSPQDGKQQKQKLAHLAMTIVTKGENAQRGIEMDKKQTEALLDILSNIAESLRAIAVNAGSIEYHQRHLTDISNSGFGFVKDVADAIRERGEK